MRKLGRKCTSALLALALLVSVLPISAASAQAEGKRSGTENNSINYDEGTAIKSDAELGDLTVSGQSGFQGHFQYGDTITVTFTPERKANTKTNALTENTATLSYTPTGGEAKQLATATAQAGGSFKLTYDTKEKKLPIGENLPLTVSYGGSGALNPTEKK